MPDDPKPPPPAQPATKPAAPKPFRVRAVTRGFYGRLREAGEIFDCAKDGDLGAWMDPVDAEDRKRLAQRLEAYEHRRPFIPADRTKVPPTTGPGHEKPRA